MFGERETAAIINRAQIQMERTRLRDWLNGRNKIVEDFFTSLVENDYRITRDGFSKAEHPHALLTTTVYETNFVNRENRELSRGVIPREPMQKKLKELGFDIDKSMQLRLRIP